MQGKNSFTHSGDEPIRLAIDLVNTDIDSGSGVHDLLVRHDLTGPIGSADVTTLQEIGRTLRTVFTAPHETSSAVRLNTLAERIGAVPRLADGKPLPHSCGSGRRYGERIASIVVLAVMSAFCEYGPARMGVCALADCRNVFVDQTKNSSRRYCSPGHARRAGTAAYRERRRVTNPAPGG